MKIFDFVQTAVRFAVCIPLLAGFMSGCAAENGSSGGTLTHYASADASYTVTFTTEGNGAADGAITGACERSGATTVMRVTSPERLCGLSVTYDGSACSVTVGETSILLSPDAAAGLTDLFDLLARTAEDGGVPAKSADGTKTVVTFDMGSVTVGETGVPVEAAFDGRTVLIGDFTIQ